MAYPSAKSVFPTLGLRSRRRSLRAPRMATRMVTWDTKAIAEGFRCIPADPFAANSADTNHDDHLRESHATTTTTATCFCLLHGIENGKKGQQRSHGYI